MIRNKEYSGPVMTDFKERRTYPRVIIEGANVAYKQQEKFDLFGRYSAYFPLRDLAKGGICLEMDSRLDSGITLDMKVSFPGEKYVQVKGTIVWSENITGNGRIFAGVRFLPFGKGRMYNSFECWDSLEQIIGNYSSNTNTN